MKISEIKSNAKRTIEPQKNTLYKGAGILVAVYVAFLFLKLFLQEQNLHALSDIVEIFSEFLLYPLILANIAMVAKIYQGESIKGSDALKNYSSAKSFLKSLWAYILPGLLIFLWSIPLIIIIIIGVGSVALTAVAGADVPPVLIVGLLLFGIPAFLLITIKSLQYVLNPYILADNPNMSVWDSIVWSKQLMKGYKLKFFLLGLSFIGWFFLMAILFVMGAFGISALGIGEVSSAPNAISSIAPVFLLAIPAVLFLMIWLIPYYNATVYEFYNYIKREKSEQKVEQNEHNHDNHEEQLK